MGTQEEKDNLKKIFAANLKAQMREKDVTTSDLSRAFDLPFSTSCYIFPLRVAFF